MKIALPPFAADLPVQHLQLRDSTARVAAPLRTIGATERALGSKKSLHLYRAAPRKELAAAIADLRGCVSHDGTVDFERFYAVRPVRNTCGKMYLASEKLERFVARRGDMRIGALQLRVWTVRPLRNRGVATVAELVRAARKGLPIELHGEEGYVSEVAPKLMALARFSDHEGLVDWDGFAEHLRIPVVGGGSAIDSGEELLLRFYAAVAAAIRFQFGETAYLDMKHRLLTPHGCEMTLIDLGRLIGVTRERVRQCESTTLRDIRRIIWDNDYTNWRCRIADELRLRLVRFAGMFHATDRNVFLRGEWRRAAREFFGLSDGHALVHSRLLMELANLRPVSLGREHADDALLANEIVFAGVAQARRSINKLLEAGSRNRLPLSRIHGLTVATVRKPFSLDDVRSLIASIPHIEYDEQTKRYHGPRPKLRIGDALYQMLQQRQQPVSLRSFQYAFLGKDGLPRWDIRNITNEVAKDPRFVAIAHSGKRALRDWRKVETRSIVDVAAEIVQGASAPVSTAQLFAAVSRRRPVKPDSIRRLLSGDPRFNRVSKGRWAAAAPKTVASK